MKTARYSDIRCKLDHIASNVPTNTELFGPDHLESMYEVGGTRVVKKSLIDPR